MNKPIIIANWKMNGNRQFADDYIKNLTQYLASGQMANCEIAICPPFTLLSQFNNLDAIKLAGQDCAATSDIYGQYTGEISAKMLADAACQYVLCGHSERRKLFAETNEIVKQKAENAHHATITAIICIGESQTERESGTALQALENQAINSLPATATAENTIIAYEPIWAIGTGKVPNNKEIEEVFSFLHHLFEKKFKLIYGGSVNQANANNILANDLVSGLLIGGASLDFASFSSILTSIKIK